jgi:hypothetical protein
VLDASSKIFFKYQKCLAKYLDTLFSFGGFYKNIKFQSRTGSFHPLAVAFVMAMKQWELGLTV